jgi:glycosyltransferase involved in cell wall biosynthesis
MTATLTAGDAIGNYIEMIRTAFSPRCEVAVFADRGTGERAFLPSYAYVPTADDILWFHYSIYSENFACVRRRGPDFKIMDYHGVCPPEMFSADESEMKRLTARALRELPKRRDVFDLCLVHSDYSACALRKAGHRRIVKTPLAIGRALAEAEEEPFLAQHLSQIEYLLFVGRVVEQKDVLGAIELFARVREQRPQLKMWIVGDRSASPQYQQQIAVLLARLKLERDVGLAGRLADPCLLQPFFTFARMLVMLSRWESFCVPVVEAMGCGVPTVTSERTCLPEIVADAGLVIDRANLEGAAQEIAALLDDDQRYGELRRRCLARAPLFSEAQMVKTLFEVAGRYFPLAPDAK